VILGSDVLEWHQMSHWRNGPKGRGEASLNRREKTDARALTQEHGVNLNFSNRPVRTRMPGGVGGESR